MARKAKKKWEEKAHPRDEYGRFIAQAYDPNAAYQNHSPSASQYQQPQQLLNLQRRIRGQAYQQFNTNTHYTPRIN
jgi:hypothetical protein